MRILRWIAGLLLLMASAGCQEGPASVAPLQGTVWNTVQGEERSLKELMGSAGTVFITLDPECPFCQLYTHTFNAIADRFAGQGITVVGLYPGPFMQLEQVLPFSADAGFAFAQVLDDQCVLSGALRARVTPECFLTDADGKVVYRGAVDDRAVRQGRKKVQAQQHHLADAIAAFLATGSPQAEVAAVGCIVECGE